MSDKPSRNEEEYFARRDAELRQARRAEAQQAEAEAQRKTHYMKCPKCGFELETEEYHGIEIDRCTQCDGVWFDAGEVEQLIDGEHEGLLASVFSAVVRGVRAKKTTPNE